MSEEEHHADYANFDAFEHKEDILENLLMSYKALSEDQRNWVCNLANISSLLWHAYKNMNIEVNWTGFYITMKNEKELILGPFQGKVACQTIEFGKGVCGVAASTQRTQIVADVNTFHDHIACDGETKSEIVVPIISKQGKTLGVIDLDCIDYNGFNELDQKFLEELAHLIVETCDFDL